MTTGLIVVAAVLVFVAALLFRSRDRMVFPIRGGGLVEPARVGIADGELVRVPVDGGATLQGWLLPAAPRPAGRAPVLVWFHGNGETVLGVAPVLRAFRVPGVALLAVDYRGYGASTGTPTIANTERDGLALWDWIAARPDLDAARVIVYGRSVGSGPAVALAAQRPVAGLVLESAFTSVAAMGRRMFPFLPTSLVRLGFDNLRRIGAVTAPLLIIHGDRDSVVPTPMARELYDEAVKHGARAELWLIPGADHNTTFDVGGAEYVRRVNAFVRRYMLIQ